MVIGINFAGETPLCAYLIAIKLNKRRHIYTSSMLTTTASCLGKVAFAYFPHTRCTSELRDALYAFRPGPRLEWHTLHNTERKSIWIDFMPLVKRLVSYVMNFPLIYVIYRRIESDRYV